MYFLNLIIFTILTKKSKHKNIVKMVKKVVYRPQMQTNQPPKNYSQQPNNLTA